MNITAYGLQRVFNFNLFGTVKEAQMNSGETSVMYESSIFCLGVDIYLLILVVRMTIHNNRSFHSLDLTDSFGKEVKTITKISDAIPTLAVDNCILFLLKLLLHKVLILLYQMLLIASLNQNIFLVANDNIFVVAFIHSHEHFVTINTPQ